MVAEALACGGPVLISDKINIWREIVADGAGLVGPDTEAGASAVLQQFLALTPEGKSDMKARARGCYTLRFDVRKATEAMFNAIARVTAGR